MFYNAEKVLDVEDTSKFLRNLSSVTPGEINDMYQIAGILQSIIFEELLRHFYLYPYRQYLQVVLDLGP